MNGEEEEDGAVERTEEKECTLHQIPSLGGFLKVIFVLRKALIQINSQLARPLICMPELHPR